VLFRYIYVEVYAYVYVRASVCLCVHACTRVRVHVCVRACERSCFEISIFKTELNILLYTCPGHMPFETSMNRFADSLTTHALGGWYL